MGRDITDPLFGPNATTQETVLRAGLPGADWVPSTLNDPAPGLDTMITWWNEKYDAVQQSFPSSPPSKDGLLDILLGDALHQTKDQTGKLSPLDRTKAIVSALTKLDAAVAARTGGASQTTVDAASALRDASFVLGMTAIASYDNGQGNSRAEREKSTITTARKAFAQDQVRSLALRCGEAPPTARPGADETASNYASLAFGSNDVNVAVPVTQLTDRGREWLAATGVAPTGGAFDVRETTRTLAKAFEDAGTSKSGRSDAVAKLGACGAALREHLSATITADAAKGQLTTYFPDTTKALSAGMVFDETMRMPLDLDRNRSNGALRGPLPTHLITDTTSKRAAVEVKAERDQSRDRRADTTSSSSSSGGPSSSDRMGPRR